MDSNGLWSVKEGIEMSQIATELYWHKKGHREVIGDTLLEAWDVGRRLSASGRPVEFGGWEFPHWHIRWGQYGYPTFELTDGLASGLLMTKCNGLRVSAMQPPFPSLAVMLPFPDSPLRLEGRPVKGVFLHRIRFPNKDIEPEFIKAHDAKAPLEVIRDLSARTTSWRPGTSIILLVKSGSQTDDIYAHSLAFPDDGEAAEAWFGRTAYESKDSRSRCVALAVRLLMNLFTYTEAQKGEGGISFKKGYPKPIPDPTAQRWLLGKEIKLPRELRQVARQLSDMTVSPRTWKLTMKMAVRGHWRDQPCGPGRSETKRIWISPYWKGPIDGVAKVSLYQVKDNAKVKADAFGTQT